MIKKIAEMHTGSSELNSHEEEFVAKESEKNQDLYDCVDEEELPLSAEEKVLAEGDVTDFLNSIIIDSIDKDEELGLGSFVEQIGINCDQSKFTDRN